MSKLAYSDNKVEAFQVLVTGYAGDNSALGQTHKVGFTNTAADTLELEQETSVIELFATTDCWVLLKPSGSLENASIPSASVKTKCRFIASDITAFIGIPRIDGQQYLLSVIRDTADGTLYITEGA